MWSVFACREAEERKRRGRRRANEQKARKEGAENQGWRYVWDRGGLDGVGIRDQQSQSVLRVPAHRRAGRPGHLSPFAQSFCSSCSFPLSFTLSIPINAVQPLLCARWFLYQRLSTMFQKLSLPCLTRLRSAQFLLNSRLKAD